MRVTDQKNEEGALVLHLEGFFSANMDFKGKIGGAISDVILDFCGITGIAPDGVGEVVAASIIIGQRGYRLYLAALSPEVERALRLIAVPPIFPDEKEASLGACALLAS